MAIVWRWLIWMSVALAGCGSGTEDETTAAEMDAGGDSGEVDAGADIIGEMDARDAADESADVSDADARRGVDGRCPGSYAAPTDEGAMQDEALTEASGIVASRQSEDVLWLHNDSGDAARLYALGTDGRALGRLILEGVEAVDFEDIAQAACPGGSGACLWVADTGNNRRDRDVLVVYAVREPEVDVDEPFEAKSARTVWRYPFSYPGEPVDAEALIVLPDASRFYLFEKTDQESARLFAHPGPLVHDSEVTLDEVVTFPSPGAPIRQGRMITGADLHPSRQRVLVRVYTGTVEYRLDEALAFSELAESEPLLVAGGPISEPQGEAVAYDAEGTGVWTVSESPEGEPGQMLHHYACESAAP